MAKVATLQDQFPGSSFSASWWASSNMACSNGVVATVPASSTVYSVLTSAVTYDATSSSTVSQLTSAGNQALVSLQVYALQIFLGGGADSNSNVAFFLNQNSLSASYDTGAGTQFENTTAYSPAKHRYFQIAESGGTTTWSTSADGQHFTPFYSAADLITMTAVTVQLVAGTYDDTTGTTVTWASAGVYAPVGAPKTHRQAVKRAAYF